MKNFGVSSKRLWPVSVKGEEIFFLNLRIWQDPEEISDAKLSDTFEPICTGCVHFPAVLWTFTKTGFWLIDRNKENKNNLYLVHI